MNKAIILDRDGVINEDKHYLYQSEDFRFVNGIFDFCRAAQEKGYVIVVVTNQSGIARGYYTEEELHLLHNWMCFVFEEEQIKISKVYYCPFHPEKGIEPYKKESYDRKPNPGMIFKSRDDFDLDLQHSIIIGDKDSDIEAGRRAGVGTLLLLPGKYKYTHSVDMNVIRTLAEGKRFL